MREDYRSNPRSVPDGKVFRIPQDEGAYTVSDDGMRIVPRRSGKSIIRVMLGGVAGLAVVASPYLIDSLTDRLVDMAKPRVEEVKEDNRLYEEHSRSSGMMFGSPVGLSAVSTPESIIEFS